MNQFNEHIDPINPIARTTKNFVFKGKKYPIDFSLVKKYSNYFFNNKSQYKSIDDIEIKIDNYEIPEEVIPVFIACCQNKPFDINDTNVLPLQQLSIQYDVPVLYEFTSQCISKNKKSLVFQSIFFKLQNQNSKVNFDLSSEEEIIASNFFDYINNDQLFLLPISVLYRVVNNEHLKLNSMNLTNQGQFIEFLFKCLEKYKREASVLFLNLDLEKERVDILKQILARYSDVFDFGMLNPKFLAKNAAFILSELNKLKIEFSNKLSEIESENKKQKEFFESSQKSFDDTKNQLLNSNHSLEQRIQKLESELLNQKSAHDDKIQKLESELLNQKNKVVKMEEKLSEQSKFVEKFINAKVSKIEIRNDPEYPQVFSTVSLSVLVEPWYAFNDGVEWQINQDIEGSVKVESMNEKTLVLKSLKPAKKVTVIAKALDGSGVTATKVIMIRSLKGIIDVNVKQNQVIKGVIKVTEQEGVTLDKSKSKFILNSDSSSSLGMNGYESGSNLDSLVKDVSFSTKKGKFYLHALIVDNFGFSIELVSQKLITNGAIEEFLYDGSNMFNGILAHLTKISGGNIYTNKTIEITCHKFCCGSIEDFVDFSKVNNIHLYNNNTLPLWIQYDFKDRQIQINSYTIKSANRNCKIKSWKIEISDDANSWTKIDERNDVTELNKPNVSKFIPIQMSQPCRFLRIITDQSCFDRSNNAVIGKLEFFGNIIS